LDFVYSRELLARDSLRLWTEEFERLGSQEDPNEKGKVVSQTFASWKQIAILLRRLEAYTQS